MKAEYRGLITDPLAVTRKGPASEGYACITASGWDNRRSSVVWGDPALLMTELRTATSLSLAYVVYGFQARRSMPCLNII